MRRNREEAPEFVDDGRAYTGHQLELMADEFLREDSRSEVCRECGSRGEESGEAKELPQEVTDGSGTTLILEFKELRCKEGHTWFQGEGTARGIGGEDPILFEEHLASRKRREIYNSVGVPDPSIQSGLYNRTHPEGRKVNSPEQRRRNGASFFRG